MPHAVIKLIGGANTVETPTLNENSGISSTNLVRFMYDPNGSPLVQKIGGWQKWYGTAMPAVVRALWAWEDLNDTARLAVGTDIYGGRSQLSVITNGTQTDITPTSVASSPAMTIASTSGSASIKITDTVVVGITNVDTVYIATQISIGGVVLFGLYPCDPDGFTGANQYTVFATDILGNLLPATSSSTSPALPTFTTTSGSTVVTVDMAYYTYAVGDTFPVLMTTTVGGATIFGNYIVQSIVDATHFTITSPIPATSGATATLNGGAPVYLYSGSGTIPPAATAISAGDWTLDNFGQVLIACPTETAPVSAGNFSSQPIYQWTPGQATATIIPQAPPINDGIFVAMPQRQIIAWGSTETGIQDPLLISWCDIGNFNQWIPLVTNQAGQYRIPKGSRIVAGVQGPQQGIIWTDIDVWSMQYVSTPYVYSFNEIGAGCGLIARKAAAAVNGIYYWMGPSQFYTLSSSGVQPLPCPLWDNVFQNLNTNYLNNIRVAVNSRFGEIQWFYPSAASASGENDSYIKYNIYMNVWDFGTLGRSAWVDQSVLGPPIGADPNLLYLYQHETSNDADGTAMNSFVQTGNYAIGEGDFKAFVDLIWPDAKFGQLSQAQTATLNITFLCADYPGDTPTVYGPYPFTQATEYFYVRFRARLMAVKIGSSDLGSWWRMGGLRYRFSQDGKF